MTREVRLRRFAGKTGNTKAGDNRMTTWVALSGGLDSTVLAAQPWSGEVECVSFRYGQRHDREVEAAAAVAGKLGHAFRVMEAAAQLHHGPALIGGAQVPHGHYAEDTMSSTVVQGRNLLFASLLVALATPGDTVALAVHSGDHAVYPDCRPEFWEHLGEAVASAYSVNVVVPFVHLDKRQIVQSGVTVSAPFALSWSCYEGGERHCGRCGTCVERAEAFALAGITDPTEYADPTFWLEAVGMTREDAHVSDQ